MTGIVIFVQELVPFFDSFSVQLYFSNHGSQVITGRLTIALGGIIFIDHTMMRENMIETTEELFEDTTITGQALRHLLHGHLNTRNHLR